MEEDFDANEVWEEEDGEAESTDTSTLARIEIMGAPAYRLRERLSTFGSSIYAFRTNASELENYLDKLIEPTMPVLWADAEKVAPLLLEVDRLLHNFTASAMTLVDHARNFHRGVYKEGKEFPEYTGRFDDYQDRVEAEFITNPLAQFIQGLRNYSLHYKLPAVGFNQSFESTAGGELIYKRSFLLSRNQLLQFKNWNKPSKEYIDSYKGGGVDLLKAVVDYRDKVVAFYEWFKGRLEVIHEEDFRRLHERETALAVQEMERWVDGCLHLPEHTDFTEEEAFDLFASGDFLRQLSDVGNDPSKRAEKAIELLGKFFEVPEELKDRIRQLYTRRNLRLVKMS